MATYIKALVTIFSADIQRAAEFHGNILGVTETYRFPKEGVPMHIDYSIGATTVAVSEAGNKYAYIADPDGTWISLYQNL